MDKEKKYYIKRTNIETGEAEYAYAIGCGAILFQKDIKKRSSFTKSDVICKGYITINSICTIEFEEVKDVYYIILYQNRDNIKLLRSDNTFDSSNEVKYFENEKSMMEVFFSLEKEFGDRLRPIVRTNEGDFDFKSGVRFTAIPFVIEHGIFCSKLGELSDVDNEVYEKIMDNMYKNCDVFTEVRGDQFKYKSKNN